MRYLTESDEEEDLQRTRRRSGFGRNADNDREITLGTRSLLGIFFGLVLICGIFFGFGYSVGRSSAASHVVAQAETGGAATPASSLAQKPSAGGLTAVPEPTTTGSDVPAGSSAAATPPSGAPTGTGSGTGSGAPTASQPSTTPPATAAATPIAGQPTSPVTSTPTLAAAPQPRPSAAVAAAVSSQAAEPTSFMVQIAAVSMRENANILVNALAKHGFTATVRSEPEDQLLHVEMGPFSTRAEANDTRARLLADGYNAIVR